MGKNNAAVRIQDDLYQHVNGEWIKDAVIPGDKPATGSFYLLNDDVEKQLMEDFSRFASGEKTPDIPIIEDAVRLYRKAMDVEARGKAAMKPLFPLLETIKSIRSIAEFNEKIPALLYSHVVFPFEIDVMEDWKDTSRYCFSIMDPGLILPDPTYYDKAVTKWYMLRLYKKMASAMLKLSPLSKKEQKQYLKDTIAFDDLLRRKALTRRESADYYKLYNPRPVREVCDLLAPFDLAGLLEQLYGICCFRSVNTVS